MNKSATPSVSLYECSTPLKRSLPPINNAIMSYLLFGGHKLSTCSIKAPRNDIILKLGNRKFLDCESAIRRLFADDGLNL